MIIIKENEIILIDYKLTNKTITQIKENYDKQLKLYEIALSKRFNCSIKKYILNLNKAELIEM